MADEPLILSLEDKKYSEFSAKACKILNLIQHGDSPDRFDEHLKSLYPKKKRRDALKAAIDEAVMKSFKATLDSQFENSKTAEMWDRLKKEAIRLPLGVKAWRPPSSPKVHTRSNRVSANVKACKEMETLDTLKMQTVSTLQDEVKKLIEECKEVEQLKKEVDYLIKKNHDNVSKLDEVLTRKLF